jgi:transcriptional regulator with XRE-family HTH domain
MHDYKDTRALREREKAEVLSRFRNFFQVSNLGKARVSRELGVSISSVERWLGGHDRILVASMLKIRHFLDRTQPRITIAYQMNR